MTDTQSAHVSATVQRWRRFAVATVLATGLGLAASTAPLFSASAVAQQKSSTKAKAAAKAEASGGSSSDSALRTRVEQLEEQLVDMQVVIGTLESLAKQGAAASPAAAPRAAASGGGLSGADQSRLDSMETQIRALTQQIEQLSQRRSDAGAVTPPRQAAASQFGSTSVTAGGGDPIGSLISGTPPPAVSAPVGQAPLQPPVQAAAVGAPAGVDAGNPKQLYETAYGFLLQQDYGAAEASFDDFLKRYPSDALAGNAQYWLGESFFVRGQYKNAASAFLKGYQTYGRSAKAPDSLLKLAMSLDRLGQKDAACSSYGELSTRFPTAAPHIKARAQNERARLSCG